MKQSGLQNELIALISEVTGLGLERIRPSDRLIEDLGLDSFAAMELLVQIEQKYQIGISDSDLQQNTSIQDWTLLIENKIKEKNPL